jgi:hypothetical protein
MQPQIMRAQKSEQILIFEINKDYWHVFKYQSTIFNHLGLFMFIGSSIADTQHIFFLYFYALLCVFILSNESLLKLHMMNWCINALCMYILFVMSVIFQHFTHAIYVTLTCRDKIWPSSLIQRPFCFSELSYIFFIFFQPKIYNTML